MQHDDVVEVVARHRRRSGGFLPVSVSVKLVEPVSTAAVGKPGSRTTNFWWKIFGLRSVMTSTPARSTAVDRAVVLVGAHLRPGVGDRRVFGEVVTFEDELERTFATFARIASAIARESSSCTAMSSRFLAPPMNARIHPDHPTN